MKVTLKEFTVLGIAVETIGYKTIINTYVAKYYAVDEIHAKALCSAATARYFPNATINPVIISNELGFDKLSKVE